MIKMVYPKGLVKVLCIKFILQFVLDSIIIYILYFELPEDTHTQKKKSHLFKEQVKRLNFFKLHLKHF